MEPELTRVDSNEDEESIVQLCSRSHRTQGPVVATIEEVPEGLAEGQVIRSEPMPKLMTVETAPSTPPQS